MKQKLKGENSEERVRVRVILIKVKQASNCLCMEFYDTSVGAHIVLQKTKVFSPKRSVGQGRHLAQIKRRQPDSGPFSAKTQPITSETKSNFIQNAI